jgi:hypothetical protein
MTVPASMIGFLRRRLPPILQWAERRSHPRWSWIASRERLVGLVCLLLSVLLLLPLPLFNTPPAVCVVLLAWGMIQRDGAFVLVGLAGSALILALLIFAADWLQGLLS